MSTAVMEPKTGYEISITRTFNAPREMVWKAWTDPKMAKEWMGPRGFTTTEFTTSDKAGAKWHLTMVGQRPGSDQPVTLGQGGRILESRPPELLKYTFGWDSRASVGLGDGPKENVITIRFEDRGGKTVMHFHQGPFATESERDGHNSGWNSAFDCFAEFMLREQPGRKEDHAPTELHLRRFFEAPRQLVFDAWTKPEMMKQWWGPTGSTVEECVLDMRPGGKILIAMRMANGFRAAFGGTYGPCHPPVRFEYTSGPLDAEGKPMFLRRTSVFFEEVEGGTEVVLDIQLIDITPANIEHLRGMGQGLGMLLDKLAKFLQEQVVGS